MGKTCRTTAFVAERAKSREIKPPRTEEEIFEDLLGPTGSFGLDSIDLASQAQADRFRAYVAKRRAGKERAKYYVIGSEDYS